MTTPLTTISMSDINTELERAANYSTTLDDPKVRELARVTTGSGTQISMDILRGKLALTTLNSCSIVAANMWNNHRVSYDPGNYANQPGISDRQAFNGPYIRYVGASSYTGSFSNTGISDLYATMKWTVVVTAMGGAPSITSVVVSGTGISGTTLTGSNPTQWDSSMQLYTGYGDWRQITSVAVSWNHTNGNLGSWVNIYVYPGWWSMESPSTYAADTGTTPWTTPSTYQFGDEWTCGAPAKTITLVYGSWGRNADWLHIRSAGTGVVYAVTNMWWYNAGWTAQIINPTTTAQTYAMDTGYYYSDKYGSGYISTLSRHVKLYEVSSY